MSFWNWFKKDPQENFLDFSPIGSHWRVVTWNFDLKGPEERRWTAEVHGPKQKTVIWSRKKDQDSLFFFQDQKLKQSLKTAEPIHKDLMNLSIHSTLKYSIEKNHEFMVTAVAGATTMDMQNETKSLQWIQASFTTVQKALESVEKNNANILTGACFSGTSPETGEEVLRVIIFNLDIFYYLRDDKSLQIVIFDDKNLGHGKSKQAAFQQTIKVSKPQFYDEITKLLNRVAKVGEIR